MLTADKKSVRVLPADVFDAIEFVAEAEGGIGADQYATDGWTGADLRVGTPGAAPYCVWGIECVLDGYDDREVSRALYAVNLNPEDNDLAVRAINERRGVTPTTARVPFSDWCAELGVERGA